MRACAGRSLCLSAISTMSPGLGIDCRYCHTSVETSSFAGIPPTKTCMNCHAQIWTNAALLEPVRESYKSGKSLVWTRVNDLPDFVYFNHSIHINKGVGCNTCHGPVDRMPLMYNQASLQMEWCLECHRAPEKNLRPRDQVFNMRYEQPTSGKPVEFDGKEYHRSDFSGHGPGKEVQVAHGNGHHQLFDVPPVRLDGEEADASKMEQQRRQSNASTARTFAPARRARSIWMRLRATWPRPKVRNTGAASRNWRAVPTSRRCCTANFPRARRSGWIRFRAAASSS